MEIIRNFLLSDLFLVFLSGFLSGCLIMFSIAVKLVWSVNAINRN